MRNITSRMDREQDMDVSQEKHETLSKTVVQSLKTNTINKPSVCLLFFCVKIVTKKSDFEQRGRQRAAELH